MQQDLIAYVILSTIGILLAIIGFFLMQIFFDFKDIKKAVQEILLLQARETVKITEIEKDLKHHITATDKKFEAIEIRLNHHANTKKNQ